VLALETHNTLAVLWSGPGLSPSVALASSLGLTGCGPQDAAETVISPAGPSDPWLQGPRWGQSVAGQQLGRYRLIERLGRGCQGDVWRAIAAGPDAVEVALKLLPPSLARDPRRLAQFRREAERRARLAVPAVLPTSELGEADGVVFMAMPLVDGCSLGEIIAWRRGGGLSEPTDPRHPLGGALEAEYLRGVVRVVARVARTLHLVHLAYVVHRDIKPDNILLERRCEDGVFLCDFGLARDLDVATPEQLRDGAGTPLYMPPERLLRCPADEVRCDVYALGATLYEAVTLVPPVQVPDSLPWPAWTSYLASTTPARPQSVRPSIPDALDAIILRAMAHDPCHRHPTAACLADDLERFLARVPEIGGSARSPAAPGERGPSLDLASHWVGRGPGNPSPSCLSLSLTRLVHPDVDAWKTPVAAE
jgi:serine/threonine protein kinase